VRVHADEEREQLADGPFLGDRVVQRQVLLDAVPVAATGLFLDQVAGADEVRHDGVGAALCHADQGGEVAHAHAGVMRDAQQCPCVVGQEAPTTHADTLHLFPETDCMSCSSRI
jgi:hypothetical protein